MHGLQRVGCPQAFVNVFGEYAGWAHNALFISQLASHKHLLEPKGGSSAKHDGSGSGASSESEMTAEARVAATGAQQPPANVTATPSSKSKRHKRAAGKAQEPLAKQGRVDDVRN